MHAGRRRHAVSRQGLAQVGETSSPPRLRFPRSPERVTNSYFVYKQGQRYKNDKPAILPLSVLTKTGRVGATFDRKFRSLPSRVLH